ncbi:MAG: ATP-grasp domain-containing protein [Planctomycetia bacterium]|nr:ATP-grasp domain-containing protein [Planctomycetia bacterium]
MANHDDSMIVAQIGYSQAETWAARVYGDAKPARMEDIPLLPRSGWMPVGTVEFCRAAMARQGIQEPDPIDYPFSLQEWIPYGGHYEIPYGDMPKGWTPENHQGLHGKPVRTKLPQQLWTPTTPFWTAPYHRFASEWRVYVLHGEIIGMGRYDDRDVDDDHAYPDMNVVHEMVNAYTKYDAPAGFGLDVGVSEGPGGETPFEDGRTKLVEVNDGWALGLYKGTCSARGYLELLKARWTEIAG